MDLQTISLVTAFVGSSIAAAWDLKTTEIPDEIPHAMIAVALILYSIQSFLQWSYLPIVLSLISGLSLLGFGFLLYHFGQWGGGDAKILSAIGFLLPYLNVKTIFPFPLTYLINVFLVGSAYMLIYALIYSFINKKILLKFFESIKASSKVIFLGTISMFILFFSVNLYFSNYFHFQQDMLFLLSNTLFPLFLATALFIIWRFAKVVEDFGFKRRIPISQLKVGDVLLESRKWEGITERELKKIKRSGRRYIWIKSGVRFAPSFTLALIFTLLYGDGILFFINYLV